MLQCWSIFYLNLSALSGSHLFVLVEQDELAVGQDAELPLPGSAVSVRTLTTGETVSWGTFNIWNQTRDTLENTEGLNVRQLI